MDILTDFPERIQPGITLYVGDIVPADLRIVECKNLQTNEAILTGRRKRTCNQGRRQYRLHGNLFSGRGLMKIASIGELTELGKIAESLSEVKDEATPLQVRLRNFSTLLTYLVISLAVFILVVGLLAGINFLEMLEISIVLAIAAIPEGLLIACDH
jgi:Ca2+-transporting ATPase